MSHQKHQKQQKVLQGMRNLLNKVERNQLKLMLIQESDTR
jgi:ribosomal protein L7Ae-like RNA K-turn-binding protein